MLKRKINSSFDNLMSYVEQISKLNGASACALFAIQNDHIVAEIYSGTHSFDETTVKTGADSQFNVASVRKSYLGLATSWAFYQGKINSLDDDVLRYLQVSDGEEAALEGVTIRNLLTYTHGLSEKDGQITRIFKPGMDWDYNSVGIRLLQTVVSNALGKPYMNVLHEKIFEPLGWTETAYRSAVSEQLVPVISGDSAYVRVRSSLDGSQGNLFVSARELAYWGYLHLKLGNINGKSIVPETVIKNAVTVQSPIELPKGLPRNGCLWFVKDGESLQCSMGRIVPQHSYEIVGSYGPLVLVVPELNLVVVRMSNQEKGNYADNERDHNDFLQEFSNLAVFSARNHITV
ncbi:CubicO group peptidase, beta-lactamase class C family [Paenibacillus sp. 1_12]|uniref:serine hydrolase domain-containing protein n=1 Tax=Paenibacillus sp. 1_12 TaxID=1566278 RepID=UPI0008F33865|nr:serine hydrolase domain-containing protein [Paenibacillus sp. 1_12]SFL42775.1 CubicO group peptidase, beta-lactamase class C family [Paenibacillus sp. 1_12]